MSVETILMHSPRDADRPPEKIAIRTAIFCSKWKEKGPTKKQPNTDFFWQMVFNLQKKEL